MCSRSLQSLRSALVGASALLSLGRATRAAGQDTSASPAADSAVLAALPPSAVVAGAHTPGQPPAWNHYTFVEECNAAFSRAVKAASAAQPRDTTHHHRPIASEAIAVGRECLSHFPIATVPTDALPSTLRLAVALDDDALAGAIVARQLNLAPPGDVQARAVVLDSAVQALVFNWWDDLQGTGITGVSTHLTQAHLQLARTYVAQLDALGAPALLQRIDVREALLEPAVEAKDVAMQLAIQRDLQPILQPVAPTMTTDLGIQKIHNEQAIHLLTYLQTAAREDLAKYVADLIEITEAVFHQKGHVTLNTTVPTVPCDYFFNTSASSPVPVPVPGRLSILLFVTMDKLVGTREVQGMRRLEKAFPDMAFAVVTQTTGVFGNKVFTEHPDQEAEQLHHYFTDSLRVPGSVCVLKGDLQTLPNGHKIALPAAFLKPYSGLVVVDPAGVIMYEDILESADVGPFGFDLLEFVRRLHAKFPPGATLRR